MVGLLAAAAPTTAAGQSSPPSGADQRGWSTFDAPQGYADDSSHSHVSIESNSSDRNAWQWRFDGPGGEDNFEPTDLSFWKRSSYISWIDVYWYVTPSTPAGVAGDVLCKATKSNNRCDRFRLRIAQSFSDSNASSLLKNNLVCHEVAHTVGFDHGWRGHSCMSGGDNNILSNDEIAAINARY